jgi:hypothetical protein
VTSVRDWRTGTEPDLRTMSAKWHGKGRDKRSWPVESAVADQVPPELLRQGLLYPLQSNFLEVEIQTAARVARPVFE